MSTVPCIVLSSSLGEVFDYVFGDNKDYHPFWASGWSARGFLKEPDNGYLYHIMKDMDRQSNVIVDFGFVDFFMNARYIRHRSGKVDLNEIKTSAINGTYRIFDILEKMGFSRVFQTITASISDIPQKYWEAIGGAKQFDNAYIACRYYDFYLTMKRNHNFINILDKVTDSPEKPFTLNFYQREEFNHHNDYTKSWHPVWEEIKNIPGMLPHKSNPHKELYPHKMVGIVDLKAENRTRERTCL